MLDWLEARVRFDLLPVERGKDAADLSDARDAPVRLRTAHFSLRTLPKNFECHTGGSCDLKTRLAALVVHSTSDMCQAYGASDPRDGGSVETETASSAGGCSLDAMTGSPLEECSISLTL